MATYQILYWVDIPVQVKASAGRIRASAPLSDRFQEAVDAAAMAAGMVGSDAYTEQFHWSAAQDRVGSPEEVAVAVAAEVEAQFAAVDWRATAETVRRTHSGG